MKSGSAMLMRCIRRRYQRASATLPRCPTLRPMRDADDELARVDELLMLAYGSASRRPELELYLRATPDQLVRDRAGRAPARRRRLPRLRRIRLARARRHAPGCRGRGLASRLSQHLVEWALARGCRTVALDASITGDPVYQRLGFAQVGATAELLRPAGSPRRRPSSRARRRPATSTRSSRSTAASSAATARRSCAGSPNDTRGELVRDTDAATACSAATCSCEGS